MIEKRNFVIPDIILQRDKNVNVNFVIKVLIKCYDKSKQVINNHQNVISEEY